jgi:hypothetical protein
MSEFTWSAVSVSGTDAEAMSGGEAFVGFEGVDSASDLFGGVRIVKILSSASGVYTGRSAFFAIHFRSRIFRRNSIPSFKKMPIDLLHGFGT